jgi:hypothetical protein
VAEGCASLIRGRRCQDRRCRGVASRSCVELLPACVFELRTMRGEVNVNRGLRGLMIS